MAEPARKFELVNLRLMAHPLNWLFVWAVLALAILAFHFIATAVKPSENSNSISPD